MDFIFDPSLVLYLPLYQLDGASFMSKDAHGHLCSVTGALWKPDGRYFDGLDDDIDCGTNAALNPTAALTVEAWVRPTGLTHLEIDYILIKGDAGSDRAYALYFYTHSASGGTRVTFAKSSDGSAWDDSPDSAYGSIVEDAWYHIAGTVNATTATLYIDASATAGDSAGTGIYVATGGLTLGEEPQPRWNLKGDIGEVRVYNRCLTAVEITHNYNATKWRYR